MKKPRTKYRKDYKVSNYLIRSTDLSFDLGKDKTTVKSKVLYYKNPKSKDNSSELFLNGVELELVSIYIDGKTPDYELSKNGLLLKNTPNEFLLEIVNTIHPESNTSLNGLYKSSGNFCTQCEAYGFRQITYYLDRPDVLSVFTTHIKADSDKYPVLLSNGNLIKQENGSVTWYDPSPKPCYLFALVAGELDVIEDTYTTVSGRQVELKIYVEKHNINKTQFAMNSLKRAFAWDEKRFGLEYDLDIYMIVAVDDFNMGAMENKGLNIFNSTYVLANPDTATDTDFINIEAVIGHEYFHNWTGNRVTCRDWFQLSLKEGLTVFRDQEFTSDLHSRSIKRIDDVKRLRTFQFAEDAGPMSHPVRPESYIEMNNFYTFTVYEKGAEVIRMIHTFLGEIGFQKGMNLYFDRHDGDAVTINDFVLAMSDANNFDFAKFMNWYSVSGTPEVEIVSTYNNSHNIFKVKVVQTGKEVFYFPLNYALMDENGAKLDSGTLVINNKQQEFVFDNIKTRPVASWLRGFSAPIKLKTNLETTDKVFLLANDTDGFSRWDIAQRLWIDLILFDNVDEFSFFQALEKCISTVDDYALLAELITIPGERILHQEVNEIDVFAIHNKREELVAKFANKFKSELLDLHKLCNSDKYAFNNKAVGNRALKNICLYYLSKLGGFDLAYDQYINANCMTDRIASFSILTSENNKYKDEVINSFYNNYKNDVQVMDKYFAVLSSANAATLDNIQELMQHKLFEFNTPNRLRSVVGSFAGNYVNFHNQDSYEFFTKVIIKLNSINPQIGARLVSVYNQWKRYTPGLGELQKQQLERILKVDNLSNDIYEIVSKALK